MYPIYRIVPFFWQSPARRAVDARHNGDARAATAVEHRARANEPSFLACPFLAAIGMLPVCVCVCHMHDVVDNDLRREQHLV